MTLLFQSATKPLYQVYPNARQLGREWGMRRARLPLVPNLLHHRARIAQKPTQLVPFLRPKDHQYVRHQGVLAVPPVFPLLSPFLPKGPVRPFFLLFLRASVLVAPTWLQPDKVLVPLSLFLVVLPLLYYIGKVCRKYRNLYGALSVPLWLKVLKPSNLCPFWIRVGCPAWQLPLRPLKLRLVVIMRLLYLSVPLKPPANAELMPLLGIVPFRVLPYLPKQKVNRLENGQTSYLVFVRVLHLPLVPFFVGAQLAPTLPPKLAKGATTQ